jgi:hypothetical protein
MIALLALGDHSASNTIKWSVYSHTKLSIQTQQDNTLQSSLPSVFATDFILQSSFLANMLFQGLIVSILTGAALAAPSLLNRDEPTVAINLSKRTNPSPGWSVVNMTRGKLIHKHHHQREC